MFIQNLLSLIFIPVFGILVLGGYENESNEIDNDVIENQQNEDLKFSQIYQNKDFGFAFKYPNTWHVFEENNYIGIQNIEGRFDKSDAPSDLKLFWIVLNFKDENMNEENFLNKNGAQYHVIEKDEIIVGNVKINFYKYNDVDCGLRMRAFWSNESQLNLAFKEDSCGSAISVEDEEIFKKILSNIEYL